MIYLVLALSAFCTIIISIIYLSVQRDVAEIEAMYKRLLEVEIRDAKIDAETAYLETLYGIDDHVRERRREYNG